MNALNKWLDEPALSGMVVGSTQWFATQRALIARRPLVHDAYLGWYQKMLGDAETAPHGTGKILELGSGSNFVKTLNSEVVTSDVIPGESDLVVDAQHLPFENETLRAILLTHVFHHIPSVERFLSEALRTLVPGGIISMIDVAHTPFARFFFSNFHPEGYDGNHPSWELDETKSYGGANQAMSWIVTHRDVAAFSTRYPELKIEIVEYMPWLAYLCSGGLTRRNLMPSALVPALRLLDAASRPLDFAMALHWHIRIRKSADAPAG